MDRTPMGPQQHTLAGDSGHLRRRCRAYGIIRRVRLARGEHGFGTDLCLFIKRKSNCFDILPSVAAPHVGPVVARICRLR